MIKPMELNMIPAHQEWLEARMAKAPEVLILCSEIAQLRADVLPRWKLAVLAAMAVTVGAAAFLTSGGAA